MRQQPGLAGGVPAGGVLAGGVTRRRFLAGGAAAGALLAGGALPSWARGRRPAGRPGPGSLAGTTGYPLPSAVFGGELQYFRMSPSAIPARLELCRQAAYTVIQTYVPWNVHEFLPGRLDFTGQTHPILPNDHHLDPFDIEDPYGEYGSGGADGRLGLLCNTDLAGFLGRCRDAGFAVILRPGPFISDEWRNGGLPDWLLETAPLDMFEYGPDGTPFTPGAPMSAPPEVSAAAGGQSLFYFPSPSYASPYYLAAARGWMQSFAAFVRPWLASRGGPVIAVQVDDETCFYYHFGPFEVDYNPAAVAAFTRATGEAPPRAWPDPAAGVAGLRPAFAWQRFKGAQVAGFLGALAADLRAAGVDVPITHEIELSLAPPADIAADAQVVLVNPELYPGADGPEAMPLIELTALAVRAAQRNRVTVWSAETQSGDPLLYTLLLGEGVVGSLEFTYTSGVPSSSVTATGRLGRALGTAGPLLTEADRRADVAIGWDNDLTRAPYQSQRWGFDTDVRAVIERHVPALATLLLRAGYSFDLLDVGVAAAEDYRAYPTIFLACSDILPRAAQQRLAGYVEAGGHLVCWAAPPRLDEELMGCTTLADACFPERQAAFFPADPAQILLRGEPVTTWLGVQTFELSRDAAAIATFNGAPCGYRRRLGRGSATLLGTWLAADSVPGRAGEVLEEQPLPPLPGESAAAASARTLAAARELAARRLGAAAAAAVPATLPGGPAQTLLVYAYTNERRGGEYISGGSLAYWNGEQVVGLVEVNTAFTGEPVRRWDYRPVEPAHLQAARLLVGAAPAVAVSDPRVQARVLDARHAAAATVVLCNRWTSDAAVVATTRVGGREVRLPTRGTMRLPAGTGLVLPLDYPVGQGVTVLQASVMLTGAGVTGRTAVLEVWAPSDGELVASLPAVLRGATVDGRPLPAAEVGGGDRRGVRVSIPPGEHRLTLTW